MSMAQEIDYTTLKWVRKEIDESLNQTRQALEAYVNSFSETNRPKEQAQVEDFQRAIYYLKHGYEQTGRTKAGYHYRLR